MDGHFVPNLTIGLPVLKAVRKITKLPLDVHLMVSNPADLIQPYADAGADRLSVQVESTPQIYRLLQQVRELGCQPGVVINPGTPASSLETILQLADLVLVMTVNPGYSGQQFLPDTMEKIAQVHKMIQARELQTLIQVDGGITSETLPQTYRAGARVFVAATAIFKHPAGIAAGIKELRSSAASIDQETAL